jgi:uncharacterized LabA/DUF88 family protein
MCPPYQSQPPIPEENQKRADYDKFITSLKKLPRFVIREGYLQKTHFPQCQKCKMTNPPICNNCGEVLPYKPVQQKGVDVNLSVDLTQISASNKIEKAIILSADGDFQPAIKQAKENLIIVTWAFFPQQKSWILNSVCDERIAIDSAFINRIALSS